MAAPSLDTPYRGGFVGHEHRFALTVYFEDTDAYGIVYYANYLRFMERARSDMIRAVGVDQAAELTATGSAYAVVEVDIRYRKPARLGDDVLVVSTVDQVRASSVLNSSTSHAGGRTTDRCAGDGGLPRWSRDGRDASRNIGSRNSRQSPRRTDEAIFPHSSAVWARRRRRQAQQPGTPAASVIAVPPLTSPDTGTKGNEMLGARLAGDADDRRRPSPDVRADAAAAQPEGLLFLSRGHRADLLEVALGRRQGAGHRLRPVARRRPSDLRLLRL